MRVVRGAVCVCVCVFVVLWVWPNCFRVRVQVCVSVCVCVCVGECECDCVRMRVCVVESLSRACARPCFMVSASCVAAVCKSIGKDNSARWLLLSRRESRQLLGTSWPEGSLVPAHSPGSRDSPYNDGAQTRKAHHPVATTIPYPPVYKTHLCVPKFSTKTGDTSLHGYEITIFQCDPIPEK